MEVTAAIILRDGRVLVAQRSEGSLAGLWEFPGGKQEPGETLEECLAREIAEELDIEIGIDQHFFTVEHSYPDRHIRLHSFLCRWVRGEARSNDHVRIEWLEPTQLLRYEFAPADRPIVRRLVGLLATSRRSLQAERPGKPRSSA